MFLGYIHKIMHIMTGLWIRNDLFRIRLWFRDPTPDPDPVSDPGTLVSASHSHCIREITTMYKVFFLKMKTNVKSVILVQLIYSISIVSYTYT